MDGISQVEVWGTREFGGAKLGDTRRTDRLAQIAVGIAESPGKAISSVCGRSGAQTVSRLLGRKEVTVKSVLAEHKKQTQNRCYGQGLILAVQDTTTLDFSGHVATKGLGPITTSDESLGLLMHSVLLLNEEKTPLGLAGVQIWARKKEDHGIAKQRRGRPLSEKESKKWLEGLADAESVVPDGQHLLVIGDRESDVFALFCAKRREGTDLLVRVAHNRAVEDDEPSYLKDAVAGAPLVGGMILDVPRQGKRKARVAHLEVRCAALMVKPPRHRTKDIPDKAVKVWVVQVSEIDAPDDGSAIEWTLLTTMPVEDLETALWMVKTYSARWVIEEFHYTLKEGCKIEEMQLDDVDRLAPAIAINAVVAWRILHLSKLAREHPDSDALTVATESETSLLERWLKAKKEKMTQVKTVGEFVMAVALLGGFMGRKTNPGVKALWEGLKRLEDLLIGYRLATGQEIR